MSLLNVPSPFLTGAATVGELTLYHYLFRRIFVKRYDTHFALGNRHSPHTLQGVILTDAKVGVARNAEVFIQASHENPRHLKPAAITNRRFKACQQ
jgi:hypothetical protein